MFSNLKRHLTALDAKKNKINCMCNMRDVMRQNRSRFWTLGPCSTSFARLIDKYSKCFCTTCMFTTYAIYFIQHQQKIDCGSYKNKQKIREKCFKKTGPRQDSNKRKKNPKKFYKCIYLLLLLNCMYVCIYV